MRATIRSLNEMGVFAADFVSSILTRTRTKKGALVIGLSGNLGSGKTAFVKAVAKTLGVEETVTSPTFVIEKIYTLVGQPFKHLIHIDAYRLEGADELRHLGWEAIRNDSQNLIFIEWVENVRGLVPSGITTLAFTTVGEGVREIAYEERE